MALTRPRFCTNFTERVYITTIGCEFGFGTQGLGASDKLLSRDDPFHSGEQLVSGHLAPFREPSGR